MPWNISSISISYVVFALHEQKIANLIFKFIRIFSEYNKMQAKYEKKTYLQFSTQTAMVIRKLIQTIEKNRGSFSEKSSTRWWRYDTVVKISFFNQDYFFLKHT